MGTMSHLVNIAWQDDALAVGRFIQLIAGQNEAGNAAAFQALHQSVQSSSEVSSSANPAVQHSMQQASGELYDEQAGS